MNKVRFFFISFEEKFDKVEIFSVEIQKEIEEVENFNRKVFNEHKKNASISIEAFSFFNQWILAFHKEWSVFHKVFHFFGDLF